MCISPCHVSDVHAKACVQPIAIGLCNALAHLYVICLLCAHVPEYIQSLQARQPTCVRSELTASHQRHAAKCRAIKALEGRLAVTEAGLANALGSTACRCGNRAVSMCAGKQLQCASYATTSADAWSVLGRPSCTAGGMCSWKHATTRGQAAARCPAQCARRGGTLRRPRCRAASSDRRPPRPHPGTCSHVHPHACKAMRSY